MRQPNKPTSVSRRRGDDGPPDDLPDNPPPGPVIPPFQPANYSFGLEYFDISNTRSRHNDTVWICFALLVEGGDPQFIVKRIGDLNNGRYQVNMEFPPVAVKTPTTRLKCNYQIWNSSLSEQEISPLLIASAKRLFTAKKMSGLGSGIQAAPDGAPFSADQGEGDLTIDLTGFIAFIWEGLKWLGGRVADLYNLMNPNCDGPVAINQSMYSGQTLWDTTHRHGTIYRQIRQHRGTESAAGCGSNSEYFVSSTISLRL